MPRRPSPLLSLVPLLLSLLLGAVACEGRLSADRDAAVGLDARASSAHDAAGPTVDATARDGAPPLDAPRSGEDPVDAAMEEESGCRDSVLGGWARLRAAWALSRSYYADTMRAALDAHNTTNSLYNVQLQTDPLLLSAEAHADVELLEQLGELYGVAFEPAYVTRPGGARYTNALFYYEPRPVGDGSARQVLPLARSSRMWWNAGAAAQLPVPPGAADPDAWRRAIGTETILDVAQFGASAARIVRIAAELGEERSPALAAFARIATPILAEDTYRRWIEHPSGFAGHFQRRGWGCNAITMGHLQHSQALLDRAYGTSALPSPPASPVGYCNAVTDTELWIYAGVLELLVAHQTDPALVPLSAEVVSLFESEVRLGARVIAARLSSTTLTDESGARVTGYVFERGSYDDHPDYRYTGYTGAAFPGKVVESDVPRAPSPASGVGWDLSHARRLVHVFDSFRRFGSRVGATFDGEAIVLGSARQLLYGASNGSCEDPRFTNFFDGTNGWYRVNYSGRLGFGYAPSAMTDAVTSAGYGLWGDTLPALRALVACRFREEDTLDDATLAGARSVVERLPGLLDYGPREARCAWPARD